ncbi:hypothetical protein AGMMS50230_11150 [Spirochaetia bacterium]|nr:hypothetical protein AGMMS50230_11150 [Spirochaetia bacterium]
MNKTFTDDELARELTRVLQNVFAVRESPEGLSQDNLPPGRLTPGPVLILPPDLTRIHSRAGFLTGIVCKHLAGADVAQQTQNRTAPNLYRLGAIMPALGTHRPLTPAELQRMFPGCPADKFLPHRWREDTVELGRIESEWVAAAFGAVGTGQPVKLDESPFYTSWPVQVNRLLRDGLPPEPGKPRLPFSLIISIGQVVPHEIAGMANHTKNIFIGTGGAEAINKSHWLGALYGLERLMGVTENPVRSLFDEAFRRYEHLLPPILWVLTVVDYHDKVRGLFCGFGRKCFEAAAALAAELNIERITDESGGGIKKAVVWLDPAEYRSTWLGNKAIYRTRKAMVNAASGMDAAASGMDAGELLILAPGLNCFGEDPSLDALIRRYGYRGTEVIRREVKAAAGTGGGLADNLSAAAHLIHGSSEGRFTIRYCTPGTDSQGRALLGRRDIEGVGYAWGNLEEAAARYMPQGLENQKAGWNTTTDGERYYFIRNPGLGLWVS